MRIAVVGLTHPFRGGISHYTTLLVKALSREHDARLFALKKQYPGVLFPGKTQLDQSQTKVEVPARRILVPWSPLTWVRTAFEIRRFRPDLCVFQYWHPFFAPAFGSVSRALHCPVVWELHNVMPHEPSLATRALARYGFSSADGFVVHATRELERLGSLLGSPVARVVPHATYEELAGTGPDRREARERLGLPREGRIILFFGYVRPYKGLDILLRAMPEIHARTGATLLVRGEWYEPFERSRALVESLGIESAVDMEDRFVANEEIPVLLAASDLVVLPYRDGTASGVVQLAMAAGRPCVVTKVGGVAEAVEHGVTGLVVEEGTPSAVADAVATYFSDQVDGPAMEEACRRISRERFGWDRTVSGILGVYEEIVARRGGR